MLSYIDVISKLGKRIRANRRYWEQIVSKHDSVRGLEEEVKQVLRQPDVVKVSKGDPQVYLYYGRYQRYYFCVICRHLNKEGFIITAYLTDKIKKGVVVYETH